MVVAAVLVGLALDADEALDVALVVVDAVLGL